MSCGASSEAKGELDVEVEQSQCSQATLFYLFNGLNCKQHTHRCCAIVNVKFTKLHFGVRTDL